MIRVVVRHKKGREEEMIELGEYPPSEAERLVALYQKYKPVRFSVSGVSFDIIKNQFEITVTEFVSSSKTPEEGIGFIVEEWQELNRNSETRV